MSRPFHFEVHASDPMQLMRFYGALFGWTFSAIMEGVVWGIRTGEGDGIDGAIIQRRGASAPLGQPVNAFVCTMRVADLDATLQQGEALGAVVAMAKFAVPGMGWTAYLIDPNGNLFGVHQSAAATETVC